MDLKCIFLLPQQQIHPKRFLCSVPSPVLAFNKGLHFLHRSSHITLWCIPVCPDSGVEIQAWSLQGVKEFAVHKLQAKSLCADTLFLGFGSMGPKSGCVLVQGEALIPWEPSSSPSLSSLRPLFLRFALNPIIFVKNGEFGCVQN